jgi:hypothetical protein
MFVDLEMRRSGEGTKDVPPTKGLGCDSSSPCKRTHSERSPPAPRRRSSRHTEPTSRRLSTPTFGGPGRDNEVRSVKKA